MRFFIFFLLLEGGGRLNWRVQIYTHWRDSVWVIHYFCDMVEVSLIFLLSHSGMKLKYQYWNRYHIKTKGKVYTIGSNPTNSSWYNLALYLQSPWENQAAISSYNKLAYPKSGKLCQLFLCSEAALATVCHQIKSEGERGGGSKNLQFLITISGFLPPGL